MLDPDTFDRLYREYKDKVYHICLRMTRSSAAAEDLTHDVFLQVERNYDSYRGDATFSTWIYRIAVNQVLMMFRKKSNRMEFTTVDGEMPECFVPETDSRSLDCAVDNITLQTAIKRLPKGYRTVLVLHDIYGYQHHEVGQILGIAEGSSKSQLHKARHKMRELLGKVAA